RRRTDRRRPAAARRTPQPATTVAASGCGALGGGGVGDRVVGPRAATRAAPPTSTARGAVAVADVAQRLADSDLGGDGRDRALAPAAVLTLITRPALLRRWPLVEHRDTYLGVACTPVALYLLLWLWVGNAESGSASLLPYVPLLNPLELGQGLVLLVLMLWLRALPTSLQQHLPRPALLGTLGATAF